MRLLSSSLLCYCLVATVVFTFVPTVVFAEEVDEDQWGAWYMYFFNNQSDDSRWGFQGDIQHRDRELIGDMEQLL